MTAQGLRLLTVTRMTSLFRRSGGGSRGGEGGQLNNSRPSRQVRRLEFHQAMEDFRTMFPTVDYEVIECVLRSNNGAVDATIDQLLQMSVDGRGSDDSSDSDDSVPAEVSRAPLRASVGAASVGRLAQRCGVSLDPGANAGARQLRRGAPAGLLPPGLPPSHV